jgi:uncharacterized membrane protein (UPF0136 family)
MSFVPQPSAQPAKPSRPIGVAVIAILGMLLGAAYAMYSIGLFFYRVSNGVSIVPLLIGTAIGLVLAWGIVYLYMGLWDLVRWAWFVHIVLNAGIAIGAYFARKSLPDLLKQLTPLLKAQYVKPVSDGLYAITTGSLVTSLVIVLYLLIIHRSFKIGVRDDRPLWET